MEVSVIYDMLAPEKLDKYRKELFEKEQGNFKKWIDESREEIEKTFNKEQIKIIDEYIRNLQRLEDYVDFQVEVRAMNYGIKIGVQLQNSIKDLYRYFDDPNDYE